MTMQVNEENFQNQVLDSSKPVLIDFWAPWCGPCRMVGMSVDKLADQYEGKAMVGKLNVDEATAIAQRYRIMSIPTLMIFKGGEPVETVVGARTYEELEAMLTRHLEE